MTKSKYSKFLLFGTCGAGKSTAAHKLAGLTGYPHLHVDKAALTPDFKAKDYSTIVNTVQSFASNNPQYIIDFVEYGENSKLFKWLAQSLGPDGLAVHFDFSKEDGMKGIFQKCDDFKAGKMPEGLPLNPDYASLDTIRLTSALIDRYMKQRPELMSAFIQSPCEIKKLHSFAGVDQFISGMGRQQSYFSRRGYCFQQKHWQPCLRIFC
jgi:hypothetical protein